MYQLMTDTSLQVSLADPEETGIEDFLSGRAQMLYQVARRMVHNTGLHDDVKDAFTNTVNKFTGSSGIHDISVTMPELRSKPLTLSHQEQYDTLKHAARTIDDRFEALGRVINCFFGCKFG